ncbi:hypothetical protein P3W55_16720 [Pseudomonas citronellolis]|uniref:Lipoprotein n=1 Tax=Pseudomonas citronellolis TaxID=53408 RepID=A0AAW6P7A5_9PSED|nr:hypothetical protein [Pseudomonas citronellolis]MDF3843358.1 hypothetical protein [Pseudomonas citronellolis]
MKVLLIVGLPLLAACTVAAPTQPAALEVRVPVAIPCRAPAVPMPVFATSLLHPSDSLQTKVRALLAERQQHLGYEARLRAALEACQ